jgi:hypothetical protein
VGAGSPDGGTVLGRRSVRAEWFQEFNIKYSRNKFNLLSKKKKV